MKVINKNHTLNSTTVMNVRNAGAYFSLILPRELQRKNERRMISKMKIQTLVSSIEVLFIILWFPRPTPKQIPILLQKLGIKSWIIILNPNDLLR